MTSNISAASLFRVDGIVAAITGGGTGIGLTIARALATNGAKRVYILGRRLDVLKTAAAEFPDIFVPIQSDVTDHASLQAAVDKVTADAGYINLLVANSGVGGPPSGFTGHPDVPLAEVRAKTFTAEAMAETTNTLHVNVTGAYFTILAFLELLDEGNKRAVKGEGFGKPLVEGSDVPSVQSQVIVTSSVAAFSRMHISSPAYLGSKAAILQLTKQVSSNLAVYGIRANALAPGLFPSELAAGMIGDRDPSKEPYDHPGFMPSRRFGGDEEMAGTVLYLASRAGSYTSGAVIMPDGGRSAVMRSSY
ncbi:uncharacterized protein C8A04DRAFT_30871 [Dichotomopilus funicola]|uniref:Uncharacterized protein n=1 Tax=Dichotomopilus funicola TaxID=1934379 RepID=A0AAN6ZK78_9PEZI|nr:hypothetical protein C8A04DRAFT_30871 [Dichotomopilus funicola]